MRADPAATQRWLCRYTWMLAAATLLLICSGGMVTSKGVGLAVPDWPTTFGYNMFLFPVSRWVGGIFFEHTHRLIASAVGFLTIMLTAWIWRSDPRRWVRNLGYAALAAVVLQGILGGLRVTMLKDEIGIFHAWLAHGFLGLLVVIALATSQIWQRLGRAQTSRPTAAAILRVALITTVLVYLQLILGATMRHQHRDLSILDFPLAYGQLIPDVSPQRIAQINAWRDARALSDVTPFQIQLQMAHRLGAVVVAIGVVLTLGTMLRRSAETPTALGRIAAAWFCLMCTQIFLGAWTIWSNKAADVATAHVAMGATMLAVGVTICALSWRLRNNAERQAGLSSIALPEQLHAR